MSDILTMPTDEVYRRVVDSLWPIAGAHEPHERVYYKLWPKTLQSWDGVGRMVEAMGKQGQWFMIGSKWNGKFQVEFAGIAFTAVEAPTPWEAVARAVLLALAESETK